MFPQKRLYMIIDMTSLVFTVRSLTCFMYLRGEFQTFVLRLQHGPFQTQSCQDYPIILLGSAVTEYGLVINTTLKSNLERQ